MTSPNGRSRCPHRTREGAVSGQKRHRFPATPSTVGACRAAPRRCHQRAEHCALLCPERSRTSLWSVAPAGERPVLWRRSKRPPRGIQDPVDGIFLMADLTQDSPQRPL
jgi:hypothetical protein